MHYGSVDLRGSRLERSPSSTGRRLRAPICSTSRCSMLRSILCQTDRLVAACILTLAALCGIHISYAQLAASSPGKLPTLITAHQAHSLSAKEAARAYPIHLQGVVTYADRYLDPKRIALFVHDASGSIYVAIPAQAGKTFEAGDLVDVTGVSGPGEFAPVVSLPQVTLIGKAPYPAPGPKVGLRHLLTGAEDGQWIQIEGIVHSVFLSEHNASLQLVTSEGIISAGTVRQPGVDYDRLVDSNVRIEANAVPLFNGRRQMVGARLLFPDLSVLRVLGGAPGDPFQLPVLAIEDVSHFDQLKTLLHRIHIRGRVTLQWPGVSLCIRDATRALCAQTIQTTPLDLGEMVDVVGFGYTGDSAPELTDATFRAAGGASLAEPALPVTAQEALLGQHDAELISIEGRLIGRDLASSDTTLMLSSGNFMFTVMLPKSWTKLDMALWENGSKLRVTGICSVQLDVEQSTRGGQTVPKSLRVLLRSPEDVVVLQRPSWWTPSHALILVALALTATLGVLGWVVVLRKRVRESEERFRYMAQHDLLTGLATRGLLHDRLNVALERAKRYPAGLGLLMLDLDKFKTINDTHGHQAGDETLRLTAERISGSVRKSDTVARMGGDEFVVLLPDLHDPMEAENIASKVVAALSLPVLFEGNEIPVSASVGICTTNVGGFDPDNLLKNVDKALYEAKARGRNCFQVFAPDADRGATEQIEAGLAGAHAKAG